MTVENSAADDLKDLWRRARAVLRHQLGEQLFREGIEAIRVVSIDKTTIVLACATPQHHKDVAARFQGYIDSVLACLAKNPREVLFTVAPRLELVVDNPNGDAKEADPVLVQGSGLLDPRLTFANFVRRGPNMPAFNAAQAAADGYGTNPLFLFGRSGCGKTHLLQAIVRRLCGRAAGRRVLFLTADALVQQFLASPHSQGAIVLAGEIDVLVCDDVQALRRHPASSDAFVQLVDDLLANGKQVVLAADMPPLTMDQLPARLRARFAAGGSVEIRASDYELRLAIVRELAGRRMQEEPRFIVGDNVLRLIAASIKKDVRVLSGALQRLEAYSEHGKAEITFEAAKRWLDDFLREQRKVFKVSDIKQMVASRYNIRVSDIDSKSRRQEIVLPRQLAMYLTRRLTDRSFPELGRSFKRDHSTVLHGFEKIRDRCLREPAFAAHVEALVRSLEE